MSRLILVIVLTMTVCLKGATAVSQFQSDASFSIVDDDLAIPTPSTTPPTVSTGTPSSTSPVVTTPVTTPITPPVTSPVGSSTSSPPTATPVPILVRLNPVSGFDQPPPVLLRGEDGFDPETGIFHIVDHGYYVFIVHRVGITLGNPAVTLTLVPSSDSTTNVTLASLDDHGDGIITTIHVVAELESGDTVVIANPSEAEVAGDSDNPFIYNAFLLAHKPITSFPRVRQSAFSVTVNGNLTEAGTTFTAYNDPAVDIGEDFDAENGVFLVPFRGLYVFHLAGTFTATATDRPVVALTVNGFERARVQVRLNPAQTTKNAAITIAQILQQGDAVQLVNVVPTPSTDCEATLVGYLLS